MTEYEFYKRIALYRYPRVMLVLAANELLGAALTLLGIGSFIPFVGKLLGGKGDVPGPVKTVLEPIGILEWSPIQILFLLATIGFLVILLDMVRTYISGYIGVHVHAAIKGSLNEALCTTTWERFSALDQGRYMQCMISESSLARGAVNDMAGALAFAFITCLLLTWIVITSPSTFLVFTLLAVLFWLVSRSLLRKVREVARQRIDTMSTLNSRVTDLRHVFKFLLAENCVTQIGDPIQGNIDDVARLERRQVMLSVIINNLVSITGLILITAVASMYLTIYESAGSALLFDAIVLQRVSGYFSNFNRKRKAMLQKIPSYEACTEMVAAATPEDPVNRGSESVSSISEGIDLRSISFRYKEGPLILRDLNLALPSRGLVLFVGESGSGKTTAVDHVVGLLASEEGGDVYCDGKPLGEIGRSEWAKLIAYVPQEAYIYAGTIRDYLKTGASVVNDECLWEVLALANADTVVDRLPRGLDTWVEAGGREFSGGERHRLSIARALVRDAKLVVLDEPSASLDRVSESLIFHNLRAMAAFRLIVVVTHSRHMEEHADLVYVFHEGQVADVLRPKC